MNERDLIHRCNDFDMGVVVHEGTVSIPKGLQSVLIVMPTQHEMALELDLDILDMDVQFVLEGHTYKTDHKLKIVIGSENFSAQCRHMDRKVIGELAYNMGFGFEKGSRTLISLPDEMLKGVRLEIFQISILTIDWNRRGIKEVLERAYEYRNLSG